jgi:hypothetical protein
MARWSLRAHQELSRWKKMGDVYTPSSDDMKHLNKPSRREMDFVHSFNNEDYLHSNVIDLEKYIMGAGENENGDGLMGQSAYEEEFLSTDDEGHDPLNWKIEKEPGSLIAEKEWEVICEEGACGWEMI